MHAVLVGELEQGILRPSTFTVEISLSQKFDHGCAYQVDHGDEGNHVPGTSGPETDCLEDPIGFFQLCI